MKSLLGFAAAVFLVPSMASGQTWPNKTIATPNLVQTDFGPNGSALPFDGADYCGPTSATMALGYLNQAGFTQLLGVHAKQEDYLNLVKVLSGLGGSSDSGGTLISDLQTGLRNYFSAKGIGAENWNITHWDRGYHRSIHQIAAMNAGQNILIGLIGWYRNNDGVYDRVGGHFVVITDQDAASGTLTIHNPYPFALLDQPNLPAYVQQTTPMADFMATHKNNNSGLGNARYLQFDTSQVGPTKAVQGILEQVFAIRVDASQLPYYGFSRRNWKINSQKTLNTGGGDLVVDTQVTGAGGINKLDEGNLVFRKAVTLAGGHDIRAGGMVSRVVAGDAFGTGSIALSGTGNLKLLPDDAVPTAVSLSVASRSRLHKNGAQLSFSGGNAIELRRGANPSLSVTVGGNSGNEVPNLVESGPAPTLVIDADDLGGTENLRVEGSGGNLPPITNGIVSPNIVGSSGAAKDGHFLTYPASAGDNGGFRYAAAFTGDINSANASQVYQAISDQTLTGAASVYALSIGDGLTVHGAGQTLSVGDGTAAAGIILNGGSLSAGTLALGAAQAAAYTNAAGGIIDAALAGSGGLVKFGPGELLLSASSPGLSGPIFVNSGILALSAASALGGSSNTLTLLPGSGLRVDAGGAVAGTTVASGYSAIDLNGGTLGAVEIQSATGPSGPIQGATLRGQGTVAGNVVLNGYLAGDSSSGAGTLTFDGLVKADAGSAFIWSLPKLVDNSTGTAGSDWNQLVFTHPNATFGSSSQYVALFFNFGKGLDPNRGNAFWKTDHAWTLFTFSGQASAKGLAYVYFPSEDFPQGHFSMEYAGNSSVLHYSYTGGATSN